MILLIGMALVLSFILGLLLGWYEGREALREELPDLDRWEE